MITISVLYVLLARDTQLLISLRMLYKRHLMMFQWLLPGTKPQTHSSIFNVNYYLNQKKTKNNTDLTKNNTLRSLKPISFHMGKIFSIAVDL